MNETDTADIVKRIVGTWPMAPKGFLWTEAVRDLDYGPALATFVQLRNETDEQRISIARFLLAYRAIANRGNTGRQHDTEHEPDGPVMSFAEYLSLLTVKAAAGDAEATHMLDVWEANLQRMPAQRWQS
jgi:hypothetical protein